jgi:hypothetical protein
MFFRMTRCNIFRIGLEIQIIFAKGETEMAEKGKKDKGKKDRQKKAVLTLKEKRKLKKDKKAK